MSEQIDNELPAEVQEVVVEVLPTVGELLREAREARGLQLADIAQALKLGQRQVEALERDEWSGLPGTTFIRGFVRNYARLVGVDALPLMARLESLLEKPIDTLAVPDTVPARIRNSSKSRDGLVVGIGAVLLLLAALAYFLLPNDLNAWRASVQALIDGDERPVEVAALPVPAQEALFPPDVSAQQLIAPQTAPVAATAEPLVEPVAVAPVEPAVKPQLRFVVAKESWLEVRDRDDTVVFSQRLPGGSEQLVGGKGPLSVTIGYAPGVSLFLRDQVVNLVPHTKGDVARLVLE